MSELEDAASTTRDTMKGRTSWEMKSLSNKEEQILKIKLVADCRITALEKKSLIKLSHEQSLQYHGEQSHLNQIVTLQNRIDTLKRESIKNVNDECK